MKFSHLSTDYPQKHSTINPSINFLFLEKKMYPLFTNYSVGYVAI